jgi:hypothetical protein
MVRVAYAWLMRAYPGLQVVRCAGAGVRKLGRACPCARGHFVATRVCARAYV